MIKDIKFSEETKEFSTGAHRGGGNEKYPTAYLPLVEATEVLLFKQKNFPYKNREDGYIQISKNIDEFKTTGKVNLIVEAGAIFSELFFEDMFECLGKTALHFKQGAEKYGFNNWQLGMPLLGYIDSLSRHFLKLLENWEDEPHQTAFMWNILAILWTIKNLPEMNDLPVKKTQNS